MAGLEELERETANLAEEDYRRLRSWFLERDWERWDTKIIEDSRAGKLDFLVNEAFEAKKEDKLRDL